MVGGLLDACDVRSPGGGVSEHVVVATAFALEALAQDLGVARVLRGLGHDASDQAAEAGAAATTTRRLQGNAGEPPAYGDHRGGEGVPLFYLGLPIGLIHRSNCG